MSEAYYHRGLTIEFDLYDSRATIEGRKISTETLSGLFALSDSPSVKTEKILKYCKDLIDESPESKKREDAWEEHLKILKRGVKVWNKWRAENPTIRPLFYDSDLTKEKIKHELKKVNFANAVLINADLREQNLRKANFHEANLGGAKLDGADLTKANFCRADLYETKMSGAILNSANLQGAQLAKTNFEGAKLIKCKVYGLSAWDLKLDKDTKQEGLIIRYRYRSEDEHTEGNNETQITVDDLQVAQFIYLLLNNKKIRDVIDTITSKAVLILGRFTQERKEVLDAIHQRFREDYNLVPILFDWGPSEKRDLTETVVTLAGMCRFIVADLTDAKSIPQELSHIIPTFQSVPIRPIVLASEKEYGMYGHWERFNNVLPVFDYSDKGHLLDNFKTQIIKPLETWENSNDKESARRREAAERERRLKELIAKQQDENAKQAARISQLEAQLKVQ